MKNHLPSFSRFPAFTRRRVWTRRLELFTIDDDGLRQAVRNGGWSSWIDFGRP